MSILRSNWVKIKLEKNENPKFRSCQGQKLLSQVDNSRGHARHEGFTSGPQRLREGIIAIARLRVVIVKATKKI